MAPKPPQSPHNARSRPPPCPTIPRSPIVPPQAFVQQSAKFAQLSSRVRKKCVVSSTHHRIVAPHLTHPPDSTQRIATPTVTGFGLQASRPRPSKCGPETLPYYYGGTSPNPNNNWWLCASYFVPQSASDHIPIGGTGALPWGCVVRGREPGDSSLRSRSTYTI